MRITMSFKDDAVVLVLSGKFLAGSDGPYLRQKVKDVLDAGTKKLVLDFSDVPYIDSTGLGFLAGARAMAVDANARIVLANPNPHVRKILDNVNLAQFFAIASSEAAAMSLLAQPIPGLKGTRPLTKGEPKAKRRTGAAPEA